MAYVLSSDLSFFLYVLSLHLSSHISNLALQGVRAALALAARPKHLDPGGTHSRQPKTKGSPQCPIRDALLKRVSSRKCWNLGKVHTFSRFFLLEESVLNSDLRPAAKMLFQVTWLCNGDFVKESERKVAKLEPMEGANKWKASLTIMVRDSSLWVCLRIIQDWPQRQLSFRVQSLCSPHFLEDIVLCSKVVSKMAKKTVCIQIDPLSIFHSNDWKGSRGNCPLSFCPTLSCPRNHRRQTAATTSAA